MYLRESGAAQSSSDFADLQNLAIWPIQPVIGGVQLVNDEEHS